MLRRLTTFGVAAVVLIALAMVVAAIYQVTRDDPAEVRAARDILTSVGLPEGFREVDSGVDGASPFLVFEIDTASLSTAASDLTLPSGTESFESFTPPSTIEPSAQDIDLGRWSVPDPREADRSQCSLTLTLLGTDQGTGGAQAQVELSAICAE